MYKTIATIFKPIINETSLPWWLMTCTIYLANEANADIVNKTCKTDNTTLKALLGALPSLGKLLSMPLITNAIY